VNAAPAPRLLHHSAGNSQCLRCGVGSAWGSPSGASFSAHNINRTVPDFLKTESGSPPSVATLASAMDVGNPSNMERSGALSQCRKYANN